VHQTAYHYREARSWKDGWHKVSLPSYRLITTDIVDVGSPFGSSIVVDVVVFGVPSEISTFSSFPVNQFLSFGASLAWRSFIL